MTVETKIKVAGGWKVLNGAPNVKVGGAWKTVQTIEVKVAGVWKTAFSGLAVSPSTVEVNKFTSFETCYAYLEYRSTGVEYENSADNSNVTDESRGNWLDDGAASSVWVQRTINSGALGVDPGSGRLQLSTSRTFGVSAFGTTASCNLTFKFYDAASGGNEIGSATFSLIAFSFTI